MLLTVWIAVVGAFAFVVNRQMVQDNDSAVKVSLVIAFVLLTSLIVFFAKAKLSTQIDKMYISYKFYPLHKSYH